MIYSRRFGCEFEFSSPFEDVEKVLKSVLSEKQLKVEKNWYLSSKNKEWHLKTDATTESELATPICTFKDFPKIKKVLDKLKKAKISITNSDSIHVHMEAKDVPKHNIIVAWIQMSYPNTKDVWVSCF
jgi:spore coat polysaccharide biosynthesis protein SpsF (cytidylyltransferase family)